MKKDKPFVRVEKNAVSGWNIRFFISKSLPNFFNCGWHKKFAVKHAKRIAKELNVEYREEE